jgi:hypothetical protein
MDEKKDKTSTLKAMGLFIIAGVIMFIGLAIKFLPDHATTAGATP